MSERSGPSQILTQLLQGTNSDVLQLFPKSLSVRQNFGHQPTFDEDAKDCRFWMIRRQIAASAATSEH